MSQLIGHLSCWIFTLKLAKEDCKNIYLELKVFLCSVMPLISCRGFFKAFWKLPLDSACTVYHNVNLFILLFTIFDENKNIKLEYVTYFFLLIFNNISQRVKGTSFCWFYVAENWGCNNKYQVRILRNFQSVDIDPCVKTNWTDVVALVCAYQWACLRMFLTTKLSNDFVSVLDIPESNW